MRIVKVTVDGCIQLTPLEMEELKLVPGQEYIIERDNDIITLTPLTLLLFLLMMTLPALLLSTLPTPPRVLSNC